MTARLELIAQSPQQTAALGHALGGVLREGDFLALVGELGAGKTQFVKGIAAGLGVSEDEPVVSPTFVLVREYVGRLRLYHLDAYRLSTAAELLALGLEEMIAQPGSVLALEWADRTPEVVPDAACWIDMEHVGRDERRIDIRWAADGRLEQLAAALGPTT